MSDSRRFSSFRRAFLPLLVIVLLVYLASQTLLPNEERRQPIAYSDLKTLVRDSPESVDVVVFVPRAQRIEATIDGVVHESHYPTEASQAAFEELLDDQEIPHDSEGTADSAWWSFATYLLPFALFFGFWIFLMRKMKGLGQRPDGDASTERRVDPL